MNRGVNLTFIMGWLLVVPASIGLLLNGVPTIVSPFPMFTALPAFFLPMTITSLAVVGPTLLFFSWNPGLFREQTETPKRSVGLLLIATVLNAVYFVGSWAGGLHYQGAPYTYSVLILNLVWLAVLWVLFVRQLRQPSFAGNLTVHWIFFAWIAWYAFPYMGELP
jgi:hypothetical protein